MEDVTEEGAAGGASRSSTVGFIGLGIMGRPMALNLLGAGRQLVVHSRSQTPVDAVVRAGARRARSPAEVARAASIVITMLPDTPDLETVVYGSDGVLAGSQRGDLLVDMSTVDPLTTRQIAADFEARGVGYVDAPVSGGERGAIDGTLSIMAGGSEADVRRAQPLFDVLGSRTVHVGEVGAGQIAKAANQIVVGVTIEAVAEALALAAAAGVDPAKVRQALLGGFAASRVLEVHGQRMLDGAFSPGFRARLHLKDARIASSVAGQLGLSAPALRIVEEELARLVADGQGDLDHSALYTLKHPRAGTSGEA
ncbi:MAG: NAD(P)-binding domain-containing protein [Chloroflexi bacterium]|nr:NAD(P)-binding domain-containing protein [Chloroflexota bacterium]